MRLTVTVLAIAALALAACGSHRPGVWPTPSSTGVPTAVAYRDPAALCTAIQKSGSVKASITNLDYFKRPSAMPREAHAFGGSLEIDFPGAEAPWYAVAAVFPDAASRRLAVPYAQFMASRFHGTSMPQLTGPNWLIWSMSSRVLEAVQSAIGGELGDTPVATSSPEPSP